VQVSTASSLSSITHYSMGIRHRQRAEKKQQQATIQHNNKRAVIMGSADDIEQGFRKAHPLVGSYSVRRRLRGGIGIALIAIIGVATFVSVHMKGKSKQASPLLVKRKSTIEVDFLLYNFEAA